MLFLAPCTRDLLTSWIYTFLKLKSAMIPFRSYSFSKMQHKRNRLLDHKIGKMKENKTRLPASRSSSIGPEARFSFFQPKVKVKERISLRSTSLLEKTFFGIWENRGKGCLGATWQKWKWKLSKAYLTNILLDRPVKGGGHLKKWNQWSISTF